VTLYLRGPYIKVNGTAQFNDMYTLFSLYPRLKCLGHNLTVKGNMEFQVMMSDAYTLISSFKWSGVTVRNPPRLLFDECNSLKRILLYSFSILTIAYVTRYLYLHFKSAYLKLIRLVKHGSLCK